MNVFDMLVSLGIHPGREGSTYTKGPTKRHRLELVAGGAAGVIVWCPKVKRSALAYGGKNLCLCVNCGKRFQWPPRRRHTERIV